jgi:hypothetical protein
VSRYDRAAVRRGLGTGERERYATALAGVWSDLARTLSRLESLAARPEELDDEDLESLPALQYSLHRASELTAGITPPHGEEGWHTELAAALADARDVTAEVADALQVGARDLLAGLVLEWRGALFRVRLARHRLQGRPALPAAEPVRAPRAPWPALVATVLILAGAAAFTTGATLALWPVWSLGLTFVAAGFLAYRP